MMGHTERHDGNISENNVDYKLGLDDGTPGCDGVLVDGVYDPRFDKSSDEFQRFGYIYKLTCLVNGKVYIGQTVRTVNKRWHCHVHEAFAKEIKDLNPVDRAIRKYGPDAFERETIETVLVTHLGKRERYWISWYDCCTLDGYDKGYNASRGDEPNRKYILDEADVIRTYQMGCSIPWIMFVLQVRTPDVIRDILIKHDIPRRKHSPYNTSDLPECIIDAYYRKIGKERPEMTKRQKAALQQSLTPIAQFDESAQLIQCLRGYDTLVDWALTTGASQKLDCNSVKQYVLRRLPRKQSYVVVKMFQYYWIVLNIGDHIESQEVLSRCQALVRDYCKVEQSTVQHIQNEELRLFEQNIDTILVDVVNSTIQEVAAQWHTSVSAFKKRLKTRHLPYKTLDIFKYVIDHHLIEDPLGCAKEHIYQVFCTTNSVAETMRLCECSKEDVYFTCKYYGLAPYAVDQMRSKATRHPARPIRIYRSDGTYLYTASSIAEAERYSGVSRTTVARSCQCQHIHAAYYFRFMDEEDAVTKSS